LDTDDEPLLDARDLVGLLADDDRRAVVAALVLGATTLDEVSRATGLSAKPAGKALSRLVDAGLVVRDDDGSHLLLGEAFALAARAAAPPAEGDEHPDASRVEARVLRAFFRGDRLVSIPAQRSKRLVVLDRLAQEFEPGRRYTERMVNATLVRFHPDVAALRRYLVDEEFMERDAGEYWRAGGRFDVGRE
jgi:hypothetical protein